MYAISKRGGPSIGHSTQFVVSNASGQGMARWLLSVDYGMSTISAASTLTTPAHTGHKVSTSIYRGWRTLPSDVQVQDGVDKGPPEDRPALPSVHLRRSQPLMVLLPHTKSWIASLPEPVRPYTLAAQFARIANLLCADWDDPPACTKYLAELLIDHRGGRKGFPMAVLRELNVLQAYYVGLYGTFDWSQQRS